MCETSTGQALYLHQKWTRIPKPPVAASDAAPTKLAIGVEVRFYSCACGYPFVSSPTQHTHPCPLKGGFSLEDKSYDIQKEHSVVIMPARHAIVRKLSALRVCAKACSTGPEQRASFGRQHVPYDKSELPELVIQCVEAILTHASASSQAEVMEWQETLVPSKYAASLVQEDPTGRNIPPDPTKWRDAETGATENLWLNLSDGYIGGGERPRPCRGLCLAWLLPQTTSAQGGSMLMGRAAVGVH